MPKQKTRKSASKRFKLTKTGKLLRRKQNLSHRKKHKSKSQQRRAKRAVEMKGRFKSKIKRMIQS